MFKKKKRIAKIEAHKPCIFLHIYIYIFCKDEENYCTIPQVLFPDIYSKMFL